jgi:uncharacterized protein YndB with AHSA1/START domain
MASTTNNKLRVEVRRRMPAPREIVYQSWIDPQGIRQWMCPGDAISAEATLDVRVGGSYRIVMKRQDGEYVHVGTYQVVDPPSRLVFTWSGANNPGEITLVTVEFISHGDDSELVLTHERFVKPDLAQRYESGWRTIAEKFAAYLSRLMARSAQE